jgi:hypothetical protein
MKKILLPIFSLFSFMALSAQNLVTNPDAESLPRGTGWTIISQGTYTCTPIPTNTYSNWTLIPDGTINYPFDHTTGVAGGTIFYAGCSDFFSGVKELQQTIDVTADAANIDAGTQLYTFSGYMQTPVDNQTDQGRFIVEYLNASNSVLGSSYTSPWQSYFGGSGTGWNFYTNTRVAPATTRQIRIRLQAELIFNRYAINVYFDDISLTKPSLVPVRLVSFTANETDGYVKLNWNVEAELNLERYEVERSKDGISFSSITTVAPGRASYGFTDNVNGIDADNFYYRIKMIDIDGKISYSNILAVQTTAKSITISPNPAADYIRINGTVRKGMVSITNASGIRVLTTNTNNTATGIDISMLPAGVYFVRYNDGNSNVVKKLLVQ